MSVARRNRDDCIGCQSCVERCPMDVFYYDPRENKSVILYPENCQSCGQCYLACPQNTLMMVDTVYEFSPVPARAVRLMTGERPE